MPNEYKGVLLDVDGTLVDSNDQHAHAWVEALAESGIAVDFAAVRRAIGMGGDKLLPQVAHIEADSPQGKTASKRRGEIFKARYLAQVKPFSQVHELLETMKAAGLTLCIASSSEPDEVDALLRLADVRDLIHEIVSSSDVKGSKPAPEPVQAALDKTGLAPAEAVMLGDTPYDIEAAQKAGVAAIALRCGGWREPDLSGAIAVYDSPADLLRHWDASPLGSAQSSK